MNLKHTWFEFVVPMDLEGNLDILSGRGVRLQLRGSISLQVSISTRPTSVGVSESLW